MKIFNGIDSVSRRIFSILVLGIVCSAALTWWLAFGERQHTLSNERNTYRTERVRHTEQMVLAIDALPAINRNSLLNAMPRWGLKLASSLPQDTNYQPTTPFAIALNERLSKHFKVIATPATPENCSTRSDEKGSAESCELLYFVLNDGSVLRQVIFPARPNSPPIQTETYYYLALFLACIAGLAYLVSQMTIRPLQRLAQAATNLGQDINRPALRETGPKEILQATRAFNFMQLRIRDHIQQRTQMLAAITHDLQTPLTRLRLRLEKVTDMELHDKLVGDLSTMQMMVKEGLDLARSMDSNEALQALDIDSLLDSICSDALDAGHQVQLKDKSHATVMARPQALRRALNNLIDNAIKYGHSANIHVSKETGRWLHIMIRDQGIGIPVDKHSQVFEPFYRIETSRSRDTGGTGLGLTIAQNITRQHNGTLSLKNLPEAGLEVCLSLPLSE
ncbi:MAG: HAMP domain-containing protein [Undibacterium sp.]|nr:HAMP domain-containing protein [Undibacterium sp.]